MRANRAYRLLHTRATWLPGRLADPGLFDQIEIVDVASGETVLHWDVPTRRARRLVRELRADLSRLEPDEFARRWRDRV